MTQEYKQGLMAALDIVKAYKAGGDRKHMLGGMDRELAEIIRSEERGEQIAKQEIAKAISALLILDNRRLTP